MITSFALVGVKRMHIFDLITRLESLVCCGFNILFLLSAEAPGAGGVKFNIPKRPYVMTNQSFPPGEQAPGVSAATATTVAAVSTAVTATTAGGVQKGWVYTEAYHGRIEIRVVL